MLERCGWALVVLGMLSQVSLDVSFPMYNVAIGFWMVYCAYSSGSHNPLFGLIGLTILSIVLDVIFTALVATEQIDTRRSGNVVWVLMPFLLILKFFSILYASQEYITRD